MKQNIFNQQLNLTLTQQIKLESQLAPETHCAL